MEAVKVLDVLIILEIIKVCLCQLIWNKAKLVRKLILEGTKFLESASLEVIQIWKQLKFRIPEKFQKGFKLGLFQ